MLETGEAPNVTALLATFPRKVRCQSPPPGPRVLNDIFSEKFAAKSPHLAPWYLANFSPKSSPPSPPHGPRVLSEISPENSLPNSPPGLRVPSEIFPEKFAAKHPTWPQRNFPRKVRCQAPHLASGYRAKFSLKSSLPGTPPGLSEMFLEKFAAKHPAWPQRIFSRKLCCQTPHLALAKFSPKTSLPSTPPGFSEIFPEKFAAKHPTWP